jgi:hypothetical protein
MTGGERATFRRKDFLHRTLKVCQEHADVCFMLTTESPLISDSRARRARPVPTTDDGSKKPVVHRHHAGAVLRGYRIPLALHRKAERAKLADSMERGAAIHWDELLQDAIDRLPDNPAQVVPLLPTQDYRAQAAGATRVLQAAIRADQDMKLRLLRLDLEELTGTAVKLEDLWIALVSDLIN